VEASREIKSVWRPARGRPSSYYTAARRETQLEFSEDGRQD